MHDDIYPNTASNEMEFTNLSSATTFAIRNKVRPAASPSSGESCWVDIVKVYVRPLSSMVKINSEIMVHLQHQRLDKK